MTYTPRHTPPVCRGAIDDDVTISVRGKIEKYRAELEKIPGITQAAAAKAASGMERSLYFAEAKQLAGLVKGHEKAGADLAKSWADVGKKVATLVGGPFAKLGEAVTELAPKVGVATEALGGAAIAGGALAGVAIGVAAVGTALVGIASAASSAEERLVKAGRAAEIPPTARASVEDYRRATTELRGDVDLLVVSLGQYATQAVADWSTALSGAGALVADVRGKLPGLTGALGEAVDVLDKMRSITTEATTALVTLGLSIPAERFYDLATAAGKAEAAIRKTEAETNKAADAYIAFREQATTEALASVAKTEAEAVAAMEREALADIAAGKAELERQRRNAQAAAKIAADEARKAEVARQIALDHAVEDDQTHRLLLAEQHQTERAQVAAINEDRLEYYATWRAEQADIAARQRADYVDELGRMQSIASAATGFASSVAGAAIASINKRTEAGKRAAHDVAMIERDVATFGAVVNTALAITKAIAMFGPPPSPLGIAAIAQATLTGAAEAIAIRSAPLPTFFAGTSRVPGRPGQATPTELHGGESVVNGAGSLERLGRMMVDAVNAGASATRGLQASLGGGGRGGGGDLDAHAAVLGRVLRGQRGRVGTRNPYRGGR